jgi:hypothetical protein
LGAIRDWKKAGSFFSLAQALLILTFFEIFPCFFQPAIAAVRTT